ncbi:hypothetical protein [Agrobacterium sp. NPDC089420]|uniref:hypothetical protein n=1 Tax=Agrobacterium sp. NPDC089420 TaxID=3363918 RepID=UPI0038504F60
MVNVVLVAWPVRFANGLIVEIVPIFSVAPMQLSRVATTEGENQALLKEEGTVLSMP